VSDKAKDCRLLCMNLNMAQAEEEEDLGLRQMVHCCQNNDDTECAVYGMEGPPGLPLRAPKTSAWSSYESNDFLDAGSVQDELDQAS